MRHSYPAPRRWSVLALVVVIMTLLSAIPTYAGQSGPTLRVDAQSVTLPPDANVTAEVEPSAKVDPDPNLQSMLAQVADAWAAKDRERLDTFRGQKFLNVEKGEATVILEMAADPEVQRGANVLETVTLANGRTVTIDHGPKITIRADLQGALERIGARFETAYGKSVQVNVPLAALRALARLDGVASVRLPYPAKQMDVPARPKAEMGPFAPTTGAGTTVTEGVNVTQTNLWQPPTAFNYTGKDINLAVFDFGFTNWAARQTAGDLRAGANLVLKDFDAATGGWDFTTNPAGNEHGTACAEIASDMAPGAKMYLYAFGTDVEFQSAVADYNGQTGKKAASMSIGWVNAGPYDGTGPIDDAVNTSANTYAVFWAVAAGNDQKAHWSGASTQYSTTDNVQFGSDQYNEFGPSDGNYRVVDSDIYPSIQVFLEWPDWNATRDGNATGVDYDLGLYQKQGSGQWSLVASSVDNQCIDRTVTPTEQLSYTLPKTGCNASNASRQCTFRIVVQRYQTTGCTNTFGHWLNLFTWQTFWQSGTGDVTSWGTANVCNSITIPSDATGAVGVGATFWGEDANATYDYGLETFSSLGPRNASGGTNPGTTVNKPDVVAPDAVSTVSYGASNNLPWRNASSAGFFGTSGATPHVAGMAALMYQIFPTYSTAQIKNEMFNRAVHKADGGTCGETTGNNNRFGNGRIDLGQPTPYAVDLESFAADVVDGRPGLSWQTVSEQDNAGFNVYRGASEQGPWVKTNDALIPAAVPGSAEGHAYTWVDANPLPTGATWYLLEDVDVHGAATRHGPVSVGLDAPTAVTIRGFGARVDWGALLRALFGAR